MKLRLIAPIVATLLSAQTPSALAATHTMSASLQFETALAVTNASNINLGYVAAAQAGTYTISTTGQVTATNGGTWLGGSSEAGKMTLSGSETQTLSISTNNYIADKGVTPSAATCSYNGSTAKPCALTGQIPPGPGKTLLVGVTLTADGTQPVGSTATPSFDVVVTYD